MSSKERNKPNWRSMAGELKNDNPIIECLCGCGGKFKKYDYKGYERKYLSGHNPKGENFPNRKGRKHTEEENIRYGKKMKKWWRENKGSEVVKERNKKIGENTSKRLKGYKRDDEFKEKVKKSTLELYKSGKRIGKKTNYGEKHWNWKGGVSPFHLDIRKSYKMKKWREDIFKRDNFTCKKEDCPFCHNKKGKKLNAHHIIPFQQLLQKYKINSLEESMGCEPLWDLNNGITFCEEYHNLTKIGRRK